MKLQKVSSASRQRHGKWYEDACGTAFALELIGERWSLLVVRELLLGPRRFSELRDGLPGISAKVLAERLASLEQAGVLARKPLTSPAYGHVYELTEWGYLAEEPVKVLGAWAARSPDHDPTLPLSPASLMISFRTMCDAGRAKGLNLAGTVRIGAESFLVAVQDAALIAERGAAAPADFTIDAPDAASIAAAVYGKVPFAHLREAGVALEGSEASALSFVDLFHLPPKAG